MALGGTFGQSQDYLHPLVDSPIPIALMLAMAAASDRLVETPLRKGNWSGRRWKTLLVGGGDLLTTSGFIFILLKTNKNIIYRSQMPQ